MNSEDDEQAMYVPDETGPELPLPPALPKKPFAAEEVTEAMDEIADRFPNPHDALEELMECGSSMFDDVTELVEGKLNEEKFSILMPILIQVAFVFAPPGTLQPELNLDDMEDDLEEFLEDGDGDKDAWLAGAKQPAILQISEQTLVSFNDMAPRGTDKLTAKDLKFVRLLLRVVTDEFDAALRLEGAARE